MLLNDSVLFSHHGIVFCAVEAECKAPAATKPVPLHHLLLSCHGTQHLAPLSHRRPAGGHEEERRASRSKKESQRTTKQTSKQGGRFLHWLLDASCCVGQQEAVPARQPASQPAIINPTIGIAILFYSPVLKDAWRRLLGENGSGTCCRLGVTTRGWNVRLPFWLMVLVSLSKKRHLPTRRDPCQAFDSTVHHSAVAADVLS